ncbi:hypothetical protein BV20DRAFT_964902 [Pilatotrama ljubarskyi]|nr:hypothetical protein BV20DRAFT_964902 [Pilatotrama ljubarskyi]
MLSPPVPGGASGETWRAKKVVWTLESHDQGWGGEHPGNAVKSLVGGSATTGMLIPTVTDAGTFHAAYSWFEACIVRPVASDGDSKSTDAAALDSPESLDDLFMKKLCKVEEARPHLDMLGYTMVPRPGVQEGERDNSAWLVQRNLSAKREFTRYRIEWRAGETLDPAEVEATGRGTGEGFLQSLQPGDRVGLWMRALFPGWANVVKHASVEVFYDVY